MSRTLPERGWSRRLPWLLRGGPGGPTEVGRPSSPRRSGRGGHPSDGSGSILPLVRLRVVGGGLVVLDVEQAAEGGPQGGGELCPVV